MSQDDDSDLRAMRELRAGLVDAAHRQVADRKRRRRPAIRVRSRAVLVALGLLVIAGAATATTLISTGSPERDDPRKKSTRYEPAAGDGPIPAITAPDHGVEWGAAPYRSASGTPCALAGEQRGTRLGISRGGVFHPYVASTIGPCGTLKGAQKLFYDVRAFAEPQSRTLLFGRAQANVSEVIARLGGKTYTAKTGRAGTFLFVFEGDEHRADFKLSAR